MHIAVSGTHFMGKSTLIKDFVAKHPSYREVAEPYEALQDSLSDELALEPSIESLLAQLDHSIMEIDQQANEANVIFDRCPVDFIAYAMNALEYDDINVNDSVIAERFPDVKAALNHLDVIVFLPMTHEHPIDYTEENPEYREAADVNFKRLYRDEACDIFPGYNQPKIIEIFGDPAARLKMLENISSMPG